MKTSKIILIITIFCLSYSLGNQVRTGSTGINILLLTPNPKSLALGEATSAKIEDASAVYWNPAGLGIPPHPEFSANYRALYVDTHLINLQGVLPLSPLGLGFDFSYMSFGNIPIYQEGVQTDTTTPYELRLGVSSSWTVIRWLHLGMQISWLRQELISSTGSDGFSIDIGILIYRPWSHLHLLSRLDMSLVVQHLGLEPAYFGQETTLPTMVTVGWGYGLPLIRSEKEFSEINFNLDLGWVEGSGFKAGLGVEWVLLEIPPLEIAFRLGYRLPESMEFFLGLRAGLGLRWQGISINYSFANQGDFGFGHAIGINYAFVESGSYTSMEHF